MILLVLQAVAIAISLLPSVRAQTPPATVERVREGMFFQFQSAFDIRGVTVDEGETETTAYFESNSGSPNRTQCAVTWNKTGGFPQAQYRISEVWSHERMRTPNLSVVAKRGAGGSLSTLLVECFLSGELQDATLARIQATIPGAPFFTHSLRSEATRQTPTAPAAVPSPASPPSPPSVDEVFPAE